MATTVSKLTVEDLILYVPLFQNGVEAEKSLADKDKLSLPELASRLSEFGLKSLVFDRLKELTYPLTRTEILKVIKNSYLHNDVDEIFPVIYYAGLEGMHKGLLKFDVNRLEKSATNYLFQWILVYAKNELLRIESPTGVSPSRFRLYKKISAVRNKLSDIYNREVSDSEVYEYFRSGKADLNTMNGPKNKSSSNIANRKITLEMIKEQRIVEKNLVVSQLPTNSDGSVSEDIAPFHDKSLFEETLFGAFLGTMNFSLRVVALLKSELQYDLTEEEMECLKNTSSRTQNSLMRLWSTYLGQPNGDFYSFLKSNLDSDFDGIDVGSVIKSIEGNVANDEVNFSPLFENGTKRLNGVSK